MHTTTTTLCYLVKDKVLALEEAAVWEGLHVAVNATLQLVHILDTLGLHVHRRLFTTNATSAVHEDLQQYRQGGDGCGQRPKGVSKQGELPASYGGAAQPAHTFLPLNLSMLLSTNLGYCEKNFISHRIARSK